MCSTWDFQMGNDSPPYFSPNLHSILQIQMPKRKLRSEMELLNTLQAAPKREGNRLRLLGKVRDGRGRQKIPDQAGDQQSGAEGHWRVHLQDRSAGWQFNNIKIIWAIFGVIFDPFWSWQYSF